MNEGASRTPHRLTVETAHHRARIQLRRDGQAPEVVRCNVLLHGVRYGAPYRERATSQATMGHGSRVPGTLQIPTNTASLSPPRRPVTDSTKHSAVCLTGVPRATQRRADRAGPSPWDGEPSSASRVSSCTRASATHGAGLDTRVVGVRTDTRGRRVARPAVPALPGRPSRSHGKEAADARAVPSRPARSKSSGSQWLSTPTIREGTSSGLPLTRRSTTSRLRLRLHRWSGSSGPAAVPFWSRSSAYARLPAQPPELSPVQIDRVRITSRRRKLRR